MKRLLGLVLAGMLFLGIFSPPAGADDTVKVWTQNLYLGVDLRPVIAADTPKKFYDEAKAALEQMAANLFPLRAQRLATEVALSQPDLIALQEVEDISLNGTYPGPPFVDYLQALLDALALRGQNYEVAATVVNLDLKVQIDVNGDSVDELVRVVDSDVILVRQGVISSPLSLCSDELKMSVDGCNYSIVATVPSPLPLPAPTSINIERGYVGVDATVRGKRVFFVNTHLEERVLRSGHPEDAGVQSAQAYELAQILANLAVNNNGVPLILVGDFNSSPKDMPIPIPVPPGQITPPYQIISGFGFTDAWKKNPLALFDPNGYTCCQNAELDNRTSLLDERIDIIFILGGKFWPWEFVTTRVPIYPLSLAPNWASDHGGVYAKLIFR